MKDSIPEDPSNPPVAARVGAPAVPQGADDLGSAPNANGPKPANIKPTDPGRAVLTWSGAVAAAALIVVPLWMLLSNSAVLGGHPALPALLLTAVSLGLLWMLLLARR